MLEKFFQFNILRLPTMKPGRFLEIGCASGSFMHTMAMKGWEVEGIEFSPEAAENARILGYPVHAGSVETAPEPRKPFHLVSAWHVFEHLHEPVLTLQKLHRWTHADGWLALSMPNMDCWEFNAFKEAWYALHLPNHLYHYTPNTLSMVLERGGWRIVRVFPQRLVIDLFGSAGYVFQDMGFKNKLTRNLVDFPEKARVMNGLLYPLAYIFGLIGQTSRMTVWAQKIKGFRETE
jgi:SAM-dependent methyltransferase